jgi:hypothetical protein
VNRIPVHLEQAVARRVDAGASHSRPSGLAHWNDGPIFFERGLGPFLIQMSASRFWDERGRLLRRPYFMNHQIVMRMASMAIDISKAIAASFAHSQYDMRAISSRRNAAP